MAKLDIFSWDKKKVGSVDVSDDIFGREVDTSLLHRVVNWQLACRRQGTHSTKTRAEVRGGGRKPFRQKGTGNARQGTRRSPLMPGGAIVFGPKPRDYSYTLPKKLKALALKMALSQVAKSNRLFVMDNMEVDSFKTKDLDSKLKGFNGKDFDCSKKAILVSEAPGENLDKASKNLKKVISQPAQGLNVYDLLKYENIFLDKASLDALVNRFEGGQS